MSWSERLNKVRDGARSLAAGEYGMHDIATSVRAAANNVGGCKDEPYDITKASPELQRAVRLRDERAEERLRHVYGRYFVELDGHPAMFTCFANRIEITPPVAPGLRRGAHFFLATSLLTMLFPTTRRFCSRAPRSKSLIQRSWEQSSRCTTTAVTMRCG